MAREAWLVSAFNGTDKLKELNIQLQVQFAAEASDVELSFRMHNPQDEEYYLY